MIKVESLHARYGELEVLKDVSFRVHSGEMIGILGPNGSGKSTLLLTISGLIPIHSGTISLDGKEIRSLQGKDRAKLVSSVPQEAKITFPFQCLTVVLMGRYPYLKGWGDYSKSDLKVATSVMQQTNTLYLAQRRIDQVSGGESQMICISRAFAQETDILLLDEATSNLDANRKIKVFDILKEKNKQGCTLLCVMHDLNLAALYCRRLIFLKEGSIVSDGPTEEVFNDVNLSKIYETAIKVSKHPVMQTPQAHFVPGSL